MSEQCGGRGGEVRDGEVKDGCQEKRGGGGAHEMEMSRKGEEGSTKKKHSVGEYTGKKGREKKQGEKRENWCRHETKKNGRERRREREREKES